MAFTGQSERQNRRAMTLLAKQTLQNWVAFCLFDYMSRLDSVTKAYGTENRLQRRSLNRVI